MEQASVPTAVEHGLVGRKPSASRHLFGQSWQFFVKRGERRIGAKFLYGGLFYLENKCCFSVTNLRVFAVYANF